MRFREDMNAYMDRVEIQYNKLLAPFIMTPHICW